MNSRTTRPGPWPGATEQEQHALATLLGWDYWKTPPTATLDEGFARFPHHHRLVLRGLCVRMGGPLPIGHAGENLLFLGEAYAGLYLYDCARCGGSAFR